MTSPAPESSTPKCPNCGGAKNAPVFRETPEEDTVCVHRFHAPGCPSCGATDHHRDIGSDCAPAPASCSEVVERLQECVDCEFGGNGFDTERAEKILHEWRERRVQELPILEKFEDEIALHGGFGLTIDQLENLRAALVTAIGKATYPRKPIQRQRINGDAHGE